MPLAPPDPACSVIIQYWSLDGLNDLAGQMMWVRVPSGPFSWQ